MQVEGEGWSDCALRGLAVKAQKGAALLFYSLKPNGEEDPASTHGSCPTLAGEKWSATRWIHVAPFQPAPALRDCVDNDDKCEEWAVMGECECWAFAYATNVWAFVGGAGVGLHGGSCVQLAGEE